MRRPFWYGLTCICALAGLALIWSDGDAPRAVSSSAQIVASSARSGRSVSPDRTSRPFCETDSARGRRLSTTSDEGDVREEEFDALTDELIATVAELTVDDVDRFTRAFKALPPDRRDGCLHRLLNLIPDEKIILCTGILMDKGMDHAVVRAVFEDVLNRGQAVKKPIMKEIAKDKSHPCCSDAEWIFEVTGENPTE